MFILRLSLAHSFRNIYSITDTKSDRGSSFFFVFLIIEIYDWNSVVDEDLMVDRNRWNQLRWISHQLTREILHRQYEKRIFILTEIVLIVVVVVVVVVTT